MLNEKELLDRIQEIKADEIKSFKDVTQFATNVLQSEILSIMSDNAIIELLNALEKRVRALELEKKA